MNTIVLNEATSLSYFNKLNTNPYSVQTAYLNFLYQEYQWERWE